MEYLTYADVPMTNRIACLMAVGIKVYYHQGHSWAIPESGNVVRVGMDDFAQKLVGPIDAITCPQVGSEVTQGETGWTLLVDSKSIDMPSPVDGRIVGINQELLTSPERIGKDPYGESWLMRIESPNLPANLRNLLHDGRARKWMEEASETLLSRADYRLGPVSQDGGAPVDGIARNLDPQRWDEIARGFFLTGSATP